MSQYSCDYCQSTFSTSRNLERHQKLAHSVDRARNFSFRRAVALVKRLAHDFFIYPDVPDEKVLRDEKHPATKTGFVLVNKDKQTGEFTCDHCKTTWSVVGTEKIAMVKRYQWSGYVE